jgi:hypothetical protein
MLKGKSEKTKIAWPNPAVYLKEEQAQKKEKRKTHGFSRLKKGSTQKSPKDIVDI